MKKIPLIFTEIFGIFFVFFLVKIDSALALVSGNIDLKSNVVFNCSNENNWVIVFNTTEQDQERNEGFCSETGLTGYDVGGEDLGYSGSIFYLVEVTESDMSICQSLPQPRTIEDCVSKINVIAESQIYIVDSSLPTASPAAAAATFASYSPQITLISPKEKGIFSSEISIDYSAIDKNDEGVGEEKERCGMGEAPVSIFYSDKLPEWDKLNHFFVGDEDKTLIAKDLPAKGPYLWRILDSFKEGDFYRIIVEAEDRFGDRGQDVSELFTVDKTPPTFIITVESEIKESKEVKIIVQASENLAFSPELSATQRSNQTVIIPLSGEGKFFEGIYRVISGFDGPATIEISGKDKAGNNGTIITSGKIFSVGIEPPPKPIIDFPFQEKVSTQDSVISVKGKVREDTEAILSLNGVKEFNVKPDETGAFVFENIPLESQANRGENILSVISRDALGNESKAAAIIVKFNIAPEISIISPSKDAVLSATTTIRVSAEDKNNDALLFSYEVKKETSDVWTTLTASTTMKKYVWDTRGFSDDQYFLRVSVNDGLAISQTISGPFSVKNFIPVISFEGGELTITNNTGIAIRGSASIAESSRGRLTIKKIDYSMDGGKKWKILNSDDGSFDSSEEHFSLLLSDLKEGDYSVIFIVQDSGGLYAKAIKNIIIDFGPPAKPVISSPKSLALITDRDDEDFGKPGVQFTIFGTAEPKSEVSAVLAGETFKAITDASSTFAVKINLKQHNQNDIVVFATDHAGNKSSEAGISVIYNNPPSIKFINPRPDRGLNSASIIKWEINDIDNDSITGVILSYRKGSGQFNILTQSPAENSFSWDVGGFEQANDYQLKLQATDNITPATITINISIDNTPPQIEPLPLSQTAFKKAFTLTSRGTASDNFSGIEFIEYSIDEKNWYKALITEGYLHKNASYKIQHPFELKDGEYNFGVRAVDAAGNISEPKFEKIIVDTTPPRIGSYTASYGSLSLLPEGGNIQVLVGSKIKFTISLEGDTERAFLTVGGQKMNLSKNKATGLWEAEISFDALGEQPALITATDGLGNTTADKNIGSFNAIPAGKISFVDENGVPQAIGGAEINILVWSDDSQSFISWQSENYGEENPIASFENGEYELALAAGKYQLLVQKTGFERVRTNEFILNEPSFVNFDFALVKRQGIGGFFENVLEKLGL